jgi:hypothetical protein
MKFFNKVFFMRLAAHNRYLIYGMLGREVESSDSSLCGVVQKVCRDIFESTINVTVAGRRYSFDEPTVIYEGEGELVFAYGDVEAEGEGTDEELFQEVRSSYGSSLNEVLRRTRPTSIRMLRFSMGPRVAKEKRKWNRRS